jgi:lactoylglutathione lyase
MTLYETHLPVSDLARSVAFHRDVVGLKLAFEQPERGVAFMWIENKHVGMLGLWRPGTRYGWKGTQKHVTHFAVSVSLETLMTTARRFRGRGIAVRNFDGEVAEECSVIGWMPSAQIYIDDPDGHSVEFLAVLPDEPVPDFYGNWSDWLRRKGRAESSIDA